MRILVFCVAALFAVSATAAFGAQLYNLGAGKTTGMTRDGGVVAFNTATNAQIWSTQYGAVDLGAGATAGCAYKGSTLVVAGKIGGAAKRWDGTAAGSGAWTSLPACSGYTTWTPTSIGANASDVYIGGYVNYGGADRAMRYKESVVSATELSMPAGTHYTSRVLGIASDMDKPVGQGQFGGAVPDGGAYNTIGGMPLALYNSLAGAPSTSITARGVAISGNGARLVGRSSGAGWGACYWDSTTSVTQLPLGTITADYGQAGAINYDGSVIAGIYRVTGSSPAARKVFIWDAVNGTRDLETLLAGYGVNLTGWQLAPQADIAPFSWYGVTGISDNGKWISGIGVKDGVQSGWVVFVPEPSSFAILAFGLLPLLKFRRKQ